MIHLFDKVYLDLESRIRHSDYRFVISENNGFPMLEVLEKLNSGTLLGYGLTLSDLIGPGKQFSTFTSFLEFARNKSIEVDSRIIIHTDINSFMEIASMWFKLIFANIDSDSAYTILKADFVKNISINEKLFTEDIRQYYVEAIPKLQLFGEIFNATQIDPTTTESINFLNATKNSRSVEFLLASYYYNGSWSAELRDALFLFMQRKVISIMSDSRKIIAQCALNPTVWQIFGIPDQTIDTAMDVVRLPVFAVMNKFLEDPKSIDTFTEEEISQMGTIIDGVITLHNNYENSHFACYPQAKGYLSFIPNGLSESELESVIDNDIIGRTHFIGRFWETMDYNNLNLYLIEMFNNLKRENKLSELAPYLLRS